MYPDVLQHIQPADLVQFHIQQDHLGIECHLFHFYMRVGDLRHAKAALPRMSPSVLQKTGSSSTMVMVWFRASEVKKPSSWVISNGLSISPPRHHPTPDG